MKSRGEYSDRKLLDALKANMDSAKEYLDDDAKMESLFQDFEKKLEKIPKIGGKAADLAVLCSMIRAYAKKQYTDVSIATILLSIAALIYVVNPMDIVPDFMIGIGQLDDAAAIVLVLQMIQMDLNKYKKWQEEHGKR